MSRPLAWISLMIVLSGPLLARAEAADDLSRSLIAMQDGGMIGPVDGGVGDDPIEASSVTSSPRSGPARPIRAVPANSGTVLPRREGPASPRYHRRGDWGPPPSPTTRRLVWLQTFRN